MIVADPTLTKRQREVLVRFLDGRSVEAIAVDLRCSPWTVRAHLVKCAEMIDRPKVPPMRRLLIYGADLLSEGT